MAGHAKIENERSPKKTILHTSVSLSIFGLEDHEAKPYIYTMLYVILAIGFLALVFLPQMWIRHIIAKHAKPRPDFPGTGGELARHLLDEENLHDVPVEITETGDHYDPIHRAVRLSKDNYDGKSLSAVAIAAHEVGHAFQHAQNYQPLMLRTKLTTRMHVVERIGSFILMLTPVVAVITRAPALIALELLAGILILSSSIIMHAVTLPVEFDASFNKALPVLKSGKYLNNNDLPSAHQVLKAAAFTYIAAALVSLLDISRWIRMLR